jgi:hypothetical protein
MAVLAAALNLISAGLLIYASVNVRKVSQINIEILNRLGLRSHGK